jgi:hypothetical protein
LSALVRHRNCAPTIWSSAKNKTASAITNLNYHRMKFLCLSAIVSCAILVASCNKTELTSPNTAVQAASVTPDDEKRGGGSSNGPSMKFHINSQTMEYDCFFEPKDCFYPITISPASYHNNDLNTAIANGDEQAIQDFFRGPGKTLFPDLRGQNMAKLINGQLTVSKYQIGNEVMYFACDPAHLALINTNKDGTAANKAQVVACTQFVLRLIIE